MRKTITQQVPRGIYKIFKNMTLKCIHCTNVPGFATSGFATSGCINSFFLNTGVERNGVSGYRASVNHWGINSEQLPDTM